MLKEYVCSACLGKGKIFATCSQCINHLPHNVGPDCDEGGIFVDCWMCVGKRFPPKVVLPFEGPPATSERVVEVRAQQPVDEQIRLQPTGTRETM